MDLGLNKYNPFHEDNELDVLNIKGNIMDHSGLIATSSIMKNKLKMSDLPQVTDENQKRLIKYHYR